MSGLSGPRQPDREPPLEKNYLSSFFGLHFSQVLPSFLASTQHLCLHSLPSAFAFSQQVSARAMLRLARRAKLQTIAVSASTDFIVLFLVVPTMYVGPVSFSCISL